MESAVTWATLVGGVGLVFTLFKIWEMIAQRIAAAKEQAAAAEKRADSATAMATAAHGEVSILKSRVHDFELRVAADYATHKAVVSVEERMHSVLQEFRRDIRGLTERLDRVLEGRE